MHLRAHPSCIPLDLPYSYDYVMHESEPLPRTGDGSFHTLARGRERPPSCVDLQRRWRRDIEAHTHFDEVFQLWQQDNWQGDGCAEARFEPHHEPAAFCSLGVDERPCLPTV